MKDDYDLVWVRWWDSQIASGWDSAEEMLRRVTEKSLECRSVGWVFHESDRRLVLISHQADNGNVADAMVIPRAAIIEVRLLSIEDRPSGYGADTPTGGEHHGEHDRTDDSDDPVLRARLSKDR